MPLHKGYLHMSLCQTTHVVWLEMRNSHPVNEHGARDVIYGLALEVFNLVMVDWDTDRCKMKIELSHISWSSFIYYYALIHIGQ